MLDARKMSASLGTGPVFVESAGGANPIGPFDSLAIGRIGVDDIVLLLLVDRCATVEFPLSACRDAGGGNAPLNPFSKICDSNLAIRLTDGDVND